MRNERLFRIALNGAAGFAAAFALWLALSAPYARLLAPVTQTVIRLTERPEITSVVPSGTLLVDYRSDVPPDRGQLAIESREITFNFILLVTLFAASRRALSRRNLIGLSCASAVLFFVHVGAAISFIKADYALNYGSWSAEHFGTISRSIWSRAPYFYSVVGVHALAFALWWLLRDDSTFVASSPAAKRATPAAAAAHRASRIRARRAARS